MPEESTGGAENPPAPSEAATRRAGTCLARSGSGGGRPSAHRRSGADPVRPWARAPLALGAALALAAGNPACREVVSPLGPTPGDAARHADEFVGALAFRFGPVELEPGFARLRPRLARAAFLPSRVFDDAAWTRSGNARSLEFSGRGRGEAYRIGVRDAAPPARLPADYRGVLHLTRLSEGRFEWEMQESLAVGEVQPDALGRALTALFRAAAAAPKGDARSPCRVALPRTAAVLGRAFLLEQLQLTAAPGGATEITLAALLDPSLLRPTLPRYARFLRRHVLPLRVRLVAGDAEGRWWEAALREGRVTLRLRVRDGHLWPLTGSSRALADALRVVVDLASHRGLFAVGVESLEADVTLERSPTAKAFVARFRRPPDWDLPPLAEPLLRGPLREPFEHEGALFSMGVRSGSPTRLVRHYRVRVRESWILRWLGGFVGSSVEEFRREAEDEADRFSGEVLWALRDDLVDAVSPP